MMKIYRHHRTTYMPRRMHIVWEPAATPKKNSWHWLRDIGLIGLVSTVLAAAMTTYFQHSEWLIKEQLSRNTASYEAAKTTFNNVNTLLSEAQELQEAMFFLYKEASQDNDQDNIDFLAKRTRIIYPAYQNARDSLRSEIHFLMFDVRRNLDWLSDATALTQESRSVIDTDPLSSRDSKILEKLDCTNVRSVPEREGESNFNVLKINNVNIDWNSSTHQLIIFNYCFGKIHEALENARRWADSLEAPNGPYRAPPQPSDKELNRVMGQLDHNVLRLRAFGTLTAAQLDNARRLNTPPSPVKSFLAQLF